MVNATFSVLVTLFVINFRGMSLFNVKQVFTHSSWAVVFPLPCLFLILQRVQAHSKTPPKQDKASSYPGLGFSPCARPSEVDDKITGLAWFHRRPSSHPRQKSG